MGSGLPRWPGGSESGARAGDGRGSGSRASRLPTPSSLCAGLGPWQVQHPCLSFPTVKGTWRTDPFWKPVQFYLPAEAQQAAAYEAVVRGRWPDLSLPAALALPWPSPALASPSRALSSRLRLLPATYASLVCLKTQLSELFLKKLIFRDRERHRFAVRSLMLSSADSRLCPEPGSNLQLQSIVWCSNR